MDAPPGKENVGPYLRVAAMFGDIGVNAPRVLERDAERDGFLLLTDLGTTDVPAGTRQGPGRPTRCTPTRSTRWCGSSRAGRAGRRQLPPL